MLSEELEDMKKREDKWRREKIEMEKRIEDLEIRRIKVRRGREEIREGGKEGERVEEGR